MWLYPILVAGGALAGIFIGYAFAIVRKLPPCAEPPELPSYTSDGKDDKDDKDEVIAESPAITVETAHALLESPACATCGGYHTRSCPRVKRMVGDLPTHLSEIEFWQDGQWDTSGVFWVDDLQAIVDAVPSAQTQVSTETTT